MFLYAKLKDIDDNPYQTRREYTEIPELAGQIAAMASVHPDTLGLLQIPRARILAPPEDGRPAHLVRVVEPEELLRRQLLHKKRVRLPEGWRLELAFGHRRLRAFKLLHHEKRPGYTLNVLPVEVSTLTDAHMLDLVWRENSERLDVSPVEQAELMAHKMDQGGLTQLQVAKAWGLGRSTVANRLRLLQLPEEIQDANRSGVLAERQALALLNVLKVDQLTAEEPVVWNAAKNPPGWEDPEAPAAFLARVAEAPADWTSQEIREFVPRLLHHAGRQPPDLVARLKFDPELPEIVQSQCKRCPRRIDQYCLGRRCLDAKRQAFGHATLADAVATLEIPASEDTATEIAPYCAHQEDRTLREIWAGGRCSHLVLGWVPSGYGARPFGEMGAAATYQHESGVTGKGGDPLLGIVLGHRGGELRRECIEARARGAAVLEVGGKSHPSHFEYLATPERQAELVALTKGAITAVEEGLAADLVAAMLGASPAGDVVAIKWLAAATMLANYTPARLDVAPRDLALDVVKLWIHEGRALKGQIADNLAHLARRGLELLQIIGVEPVKLDAPKLDALAADVLADFYRFRTWWAYYGHHHAPTTRRIQALLATPEAPEAPELGGVAVIFDKLDPILREELAVALLDAKHVAVERWPEEYEELFREPLPVAVEDGSLPEEEITPEKLAAALTVEAAAQTLTSPIGGDHVE